MLSSLRLNPPVCYNNLAFLLITPARTITRCFCRVNKSVNIPLWPCLCRLQMMSRSQTLTFFPPSPCLRTRQDRSHMNICRPGRITHHSTDLFLNPVHTQIFPFASLLRARHNRINIARKTRSNSCNPLPPKKKCITCVYRAQWRLGDLENDLLTISESDMRQWYKMVSSQQRSICNVQHIPLSPFDWCLPLLHRR